MIRSKLVVLLGLATLVLFACSPAAPAVPTPAPSPTPFGLAKPGPYQVGIRSDLVPDPARPDHLVSLTYWFPAKPPPGSSGTVSTRDMLPDLAGAPYPLIISSTKLAYVFAETLVSQGFTWVSVDGIDSQMVWNDQLYQQPLDLLFALERAASNPPKGLEGIIDASRVGATGYSFDGYNALALGGARADPQFYRSTCASPTLDKFWADNHYCDLANQWEPFVAGAGSAITTSTDGLWQPITSPRIKAVVPMGADGALLFGKRGLAAVTRPVMLIPATNDEYVNYQLETRFIFENLGTPDKTLISFVGKGHMMIYDKAIVERMAHFMAAFFGVHLQGRKELAANYSKDFIAKYDDLALGVYAGK